MIYIHISPIPNQKVFTVPLNKIKVSGPLKEKETVFAYDGRDAIAWLHIDQVSDSFVTFTLLDFSYDGEL